MAASFRRLPTAKMERFLKLSCRLSRGHDPRERLCSNMPPMTTPPPEGPSPAYRSFLNARRLTGRLIWILAAGANLVDRRSVDLVPSRERTGEAGRHRVGSWKAPSPGVGALGRGAAT